MRILLFGCIIALMTFGAAACGSQSAQTKEANQTSGTSPTETSMEAVTMSLTEIAAAVSAATGDAVSYHYELEHTETEIGGGQTTESVTSFSGDYRAPDHRHYEGGMNDTVSADTITIGKDTYYRLLPDGDWEVADGELVRTPPEAISFATGDAVPVPPGGQLMDMPELQGIVTFYPAHAFEDSEIESTELNGERVIYVGLTSWDLLNGVDIKWEGEFWIGAEDMLLRKFVATYSADTGLASTVGVTTLVYSGYGKPVSIEAPIQ